MVVVKSTEFQRNVGSFLEKLHKEPVEIVRYNRAIAVLVDADEFNELVAKSKRSIKAVDLTDEEVDLILAARVDTDKPYNLEDLPPAKNRERLKA